MREHTPRPALRVLVVEDDEDARTLCWLQLAAAPGFELTATVTTLEDARVALSDSDVDVVLVDRFLPDGDGLSAMEELRALAPDAAFVLLTAQSGSMIRPRTLAVGAGYIDKLELGHLPARLEQQLRLLTPSAAA